MKTSNSLTVTYNYETQYITCKNIVKAPHRIPGGSKNQHPSARIKGLAKLSVRNIIERNIVQKQNMTSR